MALEHSQVTWEENRCHYLSLLDEISGIGCGKARLGHDPAEVLYLALHGWRWTMDFQVGPLFEAEEMDAIADLKLEIARKNCQVARKVAMGDGGCAGRMSRYKACHAAGHCECNYF